MSEKRFTLMLPNAIINDTIVRKSYYLSEKDDVEKLVGVLNEQQSTIEQLQEENKELKHWKKRIIEYLTDWFNKTEYLSVLYKIAEITNELGFDSDE